MDGRYNRQFMFEYNELVLARVTGVHPVDQDRRLKVDVVALDGRGAWSKVPIFSVPGRARNYRRGEIVGLLFRMGASNWPVVMGRLFNLEQQGSGYEVPLPAAFQQVDDDVIYHPETGAYIRFRNTKSTPAQGAGDNSPVLLEITTSTGHSIAIDETAGKQGVTIATAGGHEQHFDDAGETVAITSKGGNLFKLDDVLEQVLHQTAGGTETVVLDKLKSEIAHIAQFLGLGDRFESLATLNPTTNLPDAAAVTHGVLQGYSAGVDTQRLKDMVTLVQTLNSVGALNNGAAALAAVQALALAALGVPAGSASVRIKS